MRCQQILIFFALVNYGYCTGVCPEGFHECTTESRTRPYNGLWLKACCDSGDDCNCDFKCEEPGIQQFKSVNGFSVGCTQPIDASRREDFTKCTTDCLSFPDRIEDCMAYCSFKEESASMSPIVGMALSYVNALVFLIGGFLAPFLAGYGKFVAIIIGCLTGMFGLVIASLPQAFNYPLVCGNLGHHAWFGVLAFPGLVIGSSGGGFAVASTVAYVITKGQRPNEAPGSMACAGMMIAGVCSLALIFVNLGNSCKIGDFGSLQIYVALLAPTFVFYTSAYRTILDRAAALDDFMRRMRGVLFGAGACAAALQTLAFFVLAGALGSEDSVGGVALMLTITTGLLCVVHVSIYVMAVLSFGRGADQLAAMAQSAISDPAQNQALVARWFYDTIYVTKACRFLMVLAVITSCLFFLGIILAMLAIFSDQGLEDRESINTAIAFMLLFWGISCFPNYVCIVFVDYESPDPDAAFFNRESLKNSTISTYGKSLKDASAASSWKANATEEAADMAKKDWQQNAGYWQTPNFNINVDAGLAGGGEQGDDLRQHQKSIGHDTFDGYSGGGDARYYPAAAPTSYHTSTAGEGSFNGGDVKNFTPTLYDFTSAGEGNLDVTGEPKRLRV